MADKVDTERVLRNAGLFLASNILILVFGFGRVVEGARAKNDLDLISGVVQVFFPMISIIAIMGHFGGRDSRIKTSHIKAVVIISIFLGWFVFGVHLYNAGKRVQNGNENTRVGLVFGLLGFVANCGAMFGSQTLLGLQVTTLEEGKAETLNRSWYSKRQLYYAFLFVLFAVACLGSGAVTMNNNGGRAGSVVGYTGGYPEGEGEGEGSPEGEGEGEGSPEGEGEGEGEPEGEGARLLASLRKLQPEGEPGYGAPTEPEGEGEGEEESPKGEGEGEGEAVAAAPGVGFFIPFIVPVPALTMVTGALMIVNGLWHAARAYASTPSRLYVAVSLLVWMLQFCTNALAAQSLAGSTYGAAVVGLLTLPLTFMPLYLDAQGVQAAQDEESGKAEAEAGKVEV